MIERAIARRRRPPPRARAQAGGGPLHGDLHERRRCCSRRSARPSGSRTSRAARPASASCCCTWPSTASCAAAPPPTSPSRVERAVADPELVAAIGPDSAWLLFVIGQLFKTDRLDVARRTVAIALAEAQRRGSAPGFAAASVWRAWIALRAGAAADAEADARAAYEAPSGTTWQHLFAPCCLIEVLVERGELDEAQAVLDAAAARTRSRPIAAPSCCSPPARSCAPRRAIRAARWPTSSRRAGSTGRHHGARSRLRRLASDRAPAARHRRRGGRRARGGGGAELGARLGHARATSGRRSPSPGSILGGDEGLAHLRDAVEQLERSPARRELARSLVELGAALRRRGERTAAREPLRRALDLAAAGGLVATARAGTRGAARDGSQDPPPRVLGPRVADAERAADRRPRGRRGDQPGDRAGAVRDRQDRRDAPRQRVPQARHQLATPARGAAAARRNPRERVPGAPRSGPHRARRRSRRPPPRPIEVPHVRPPFHLRERRPRPGRPGQAVHGVARRPTRSASFPATADR